MLNGVQLGVTLFLLAAGLTLIFGIMGVINLAHGSLYMTGAFAMAWATAYTGSFWLGVPMGMAAAGDLLGDCDGISRRAPAVRARPSRPGAGDLWADPVFQRHGDDYIRPPAAAT